MKDTWKAIRSKVAVHLGALSPVNTPLGSQKVLPGFWIVKQSAALLIGHAGDLFRALAQVPRILSCVLGC